MTASFSVLLSIYYKEEPNHLNEALQSIWDNQTLKPNEVVLVKDGPLTVELDDVIQSWNQKLGDLFIVSALEKNEGTGRAKNHGLQLCNYEYVAIMDTDDISVSNRFQMQMEYLKKHPNVVVLGGQLQEFVGSLDTIISEKNVPLSNNDIISFSKYRSPFNHPTAIYKRKEIIEIGGYKHHLLMEDYNLWIRVISRGYQTANLPEVLLYQRISNGMHGRRRGWQYIKSEWQMFRLKRQLKYQNIFTAFALFLLKSGIRILPASMLQTIYAIFLREKVKRINND